jgi:hypothetical protein
MNLRKVTNLQITWLMDENGDLLADSHNILNRQKNLFCQLFKVHGVYDIRQTEMPTTEPLVPGPGPLKVEINTETLKRYKSPGINQSLSEIIQARGNTLHFEIHKLIYSIWNTKELPQQWKKSGILPVYKKVEKTE